MIETIPESSPPTKINLESFYHFKGDIKAIVNYKKSVRRDFEENGFKNSKEKNMELIWLRILQDPRVNNKTLQNVINKKDKKGMELVKKYKQELKNQGLLEKDSEYPLAPYFRIPEYIFPTLGPIPLNEIEDLLTTDKLRSFALSFFSSLPFLHVELREYLKECFEGMYSKKHIEHQKTMCNYLIYNANDAIKNMHECYQILSDKTEEELNEEKEHFFAIIDEYCDYFKNMVDKLNCDEEERAQIADFITLFGPSLDTLMMCLFELEIRRVLDKRIGCDVYYELLVNYLQILF